MNRIDVEGVFSKNETKDDIATADLRYLLAPFYLAEVVGSTRTRAPAARHRMRTHTGCAHRVRAVCTAARTGSAWWQLARDSVANSWASINCRKQAGASGTRKLALGPRAFDT